MPRRRSCLCVRAPPKPKDLGTDRDFYSVALTCDRDSNVTSAQDNVHGAYHSFGSGYYVAYTMDNVNRLTEAYEGTLVSGSVTAPTRDEQWTLSHTGNWDREKLDLNGDGDFVDANELDDTRTHNAVNELTARDTDSNSSNNYTLSYDAAGNLTDDGKDYKYVYDVWNRLRMVEKTSNSALVAEYRYNGLSHRIAVHEDTDLDGDVDGSDKWYFDVFDERWRELARYRESDSNPKEDFIPHQAGTSGRGGSSYIDLVVCRNRDANTAWTSASDGTLEERVYLCQNWRADVSAVVSSGSVLLEWAKYSAYGTPIGLPGGDSDSDGDIDATDRSNVQTWINGPTYDVRGDLNLDGTVDATDKGLLVAKTLGRGVLSTNGVANRKGYEGYEALSGLTGGKWLARNRVMAADVGRWLQRDDLAYVDGNSLYELMGASPLNNADADGNQWQSKYPVNQPMPPRITRTPLGGVNAYSYLGCGGFWVKFRFSIQAGSQAMTAGSVCGPNNGGYIVQEFHVEDSLTQSCPSGPWHIRYWEAFRIEPNSSSPSHNDFWDVPFMNAIGDRYMMASTRFFCDGTPGITEIQTWQPGTVNHTWSHDAPSTWSQPSFWNAGSGVSGEDWDGGPFGNYKHKHFSCCPQSDFPPASGHPTGPSTPTFPSPVDPSGPNPGPHTGYPFPGPQTGAHFD